MALNCFLCPNNCKIEDGYFGVCGVRGAVDGRFNLPYNGLISAISTDPVEKKPLYHFHPGKTIFSIGFFGCSLSCPFCQNYRISKEFPAPSDAEPKSPSQIVDAALKSGSFGIAYTYSEPLIHYEWLLECLKTARTAGLKNILVTNGYINPEPASELITYIDAVNIDLKSFSEDFYQDVLKGRLQPVKDFITLASKHTHTEITTLVIPDKNDSEEELEQAAGFIAGLGKSIPWHLSAYYPSYKYNQRPTAPEQLISLAEKVSKQLNFVYTGNIAGGISDTLCPVCGNKLIIRTGYRTLTSGISSGKCTGCRTDVSSFGIIL
ncbi:MAG: AmmeMemoRadiSam system radical SAM enzyme [Spirochaetales bacterium]|uniref:AmmeMemoRadiSam system radical SAM enzyme n=1 Tax=Candidatus Thalassospirochaeta sargassi TaxID=3119039 RepID=A0AAJ1MP26_9SPIO|nr:AmmeMemoRadiSam system radical SAM enzyme [Spirochaetales bacterium]